MLEPMDFPAIWNVPYRRNKFFTGREDILTHLYRSLQADTATALTQPQGMSGLGGIGKTQTALEYAYRYHADYQAVLWVRADSHSALVSGFVTIAHLLNLSEKDERDQNRAVQAVMRWLRGNTAWLLVFDNADDIAIVSEFLPTAHRGHILLTTRSRAMGQVAQSVEVEKMDPEVGAFFLLRRASLLPLQAHPDLVSDYDRKLAKEISQLMDGLPLALDQAGAYIKETNCMLSDYLSLYQTRNTDLLKERGSASWDYPESVATTWSLSFEKVTQANPAAAELLNLCAFLYPDAIPEEIILEGAAELNPLFQSLATNPLQLDNTFKELRRFSLLQREPDEQTFSMHRLVQLVLQAHMDQSEQQQWAECTVRAVNATLPEVEFATWRHYQRCILQAQRCAAHIDQWRMLFPEAAQLLNQAGVYLYELGRYSEAEPLYRRAVEIRERILDPRHPHTANSLNNLAQLYRAQGRYMEAEPLMQRDLAICEQTLGPMHPDTAISLNNLAGLYRVQGRYGEAEPLMQKDLAICEQALGPMHPDTATSLNNLAGLYYDQGRYEQAEPLYRRALAIVEQVQAPTHPDRASSLNNLAELYRAQERYADAEPLYQQALAIREQVLGPINPDTAQSLDNLAELYRTQGKYAEAESLYQRALAIREQTLGPIHPDTAISLNNLALLYYDQDEYAKAEPFYQQALTIREQRLGPIHPDTAISLNNLALLYYHQDRYMEAEPFMQRALAITEQVLGPRHSETIQGIDDLAEIYRAQGKYAEANSLLQKALAIAEQVLGHDHPTTAEILENYAALLKQMGRGKEAKKLKTRAKAIRTRLR
ncbi:MAG TPA: tetratricopeptide repeat protein [Ktedonobacteraceae bacterium]|nr:tetratricopeptide repeat protein [Ktedonobacteraceae bacterium]